jgi:nitrite reductase (NO-forming)
MKTKLKITGYMLAAATVTFGLFSFKDGGPKDNSKIPVVGQSVAELTAPPFVPKPVGNRAATKLIVNMEIKEQVGEMVDGVKYTYWTFGGSVPGSFIRTRVGDEVEFPLKKSSRQQNATQHRFACCNRTRRWSRIIFSCTRP